MKAQAQNNDDNNNIWSKSLYSNTRLIMLNCLTSQPFCQSLLCKVENNFLLNLPFYLPPLFNF